MKIKLSDEKILINEILMNKKEKKNEWWKKVWGKKE